MKNNITVLRIIDAMQSIIHTIPKKEKNIEKYNNV